MAVWLDGWMAGSERCLGIGWHWSNPMPGTDGPDALYDATISPRHAHGTCLPIVPACPALPCPSFLEHEEGGPQKMPCVTKDTSLHGACGHRPSSARLQTRPVRPPGGPRQHAGAGKASKQLAHDSSCIVALGRRASCPIGRGVDHLMCPAAQVTAIGWKSQRGYRTSGG